MHVKAVKLEDGANQMNDCSDHSTFCVGIHDKISKILNLLEMDKVDGRLIRDNKVLNGEADLDQTFAKSFIKDGDKFALLSGGEGGMSWPEPLRWRRCREPLEHCFDIRPNQDDAITFTPKCSVLFMGFGQMQSRSS